jgi:DDE superfamily endonuclease
LAASHPAWALGFEDETWWSRLAQPTLHAWTPAQQPLRVVEQPVPSTDPDPKALACYGLLVQERTTQGVSQEHVWLRFVAARPVSAITIAFLTWGCAKLTAWGKTALLLVWDNASWHRSQAVRQWIRAHNQQVQREGQGIRIVRCPLPIKSPWLNPLEAHWVHGKRAVVEPTRLLTSAELVERVNTHFGCPYEEPLSIPQEVS